MYVVLSSYCAASLTCWIVLGAAPLLQYKKKQPAQPAFQVPVLVVVDRRRSHQVVQGT
jgi:hypothetical protein